MQTSLHKNGPQTGEFSVSVIVMSVNDVVECHQPWWASMSIQEYVHMNIWMCIWVWTCMLKWVSNIWQMCNMVCNSPFVCMLQAYLCACDHIHAHWAYVCWCACSVQNKYIHTPCVTYTHINVYIHTDYSTFCSWCQYVYTYILTIYIT